MTGSPKSRTSNPVSPEPPGPCVQGTQEALGTRMICATKKLGETCTQAIHHFHWDHKAPCLPLKFCITTWYCFQYLLNITVVPRKNWSEWLCIFFGGERGDGGGGGGNYGLDEYGELGKGDQKEAFLSLVLFSLGLHVLYSFTNVRTFRSKPLVIWQSKLI